MDHLPVADPRSPERPRPHLRTLTLLVGRITTIKLSYWAALTAFELALPVVVRAPLAERLPISIVAAAVATLVALAWAVHAARTDDRRLGGITRSIPTVGTAFAAATVVASPASLPLLLVERQRSIEGCVAQAACHLETVVLWAAVLAIGMLLIPTAFAIGLRRESRS